VDHLSDGGGGDVGWKKGRRHGGTKARSARQAAHKDERGAEHLAAVGLDVATEAGNGREVGAELPLEAGLDFGERGSEEGLEIGGNHGKR
jgi:hypothetical protein